MMKHSKSLTTPSPALSSTHPKTSKSAILPFLRPVLHERRTNRRRTNQRRTNRRRTSRPHPRKHRRTRRPHPWRKRRARAPPFAAAVGENPSARAPPFAASVWENPSGPGLGLCAWPAAPQPAACAKRGPWPPANRLANAWFSTTACSRGAGPPSAHRCQTVSTPFLSSEPGGTASWAPSFPCFPDARYFPRTCR